ncbi:MAG: hypothetical protein FJY17_07085 [Bacteroidetes bacterium]|nr:hypothetical protein [Bacteroidota bacterium]
MPSNKEKISPGSRNWIAKYFELEENGIITLSLDESNDELEELVELISSKTGLVFGVANSFIFSNELERDHYTQDEALKLLLFEALMLAYLQKSGRNFSKEAFIQTLCQFYKIWVEEKWIDKWFKGNQIQKLEKVLTNRVKVNSSIFGTNYWINHLSNVLSFLDVLLFIEFLDEKTLFFDEKRNDYAFSVVKGALAGALADEQIEPKEQRLINHLLASADLPKELEHELELYMNKTKSLSDFSFENKQLAKITFKFVSFIMKGTHIVTEFEELKLQKLGFQFGLNADEMEECRLVCDLFIVDNNLQLNQIKEDNQVKLIYKGFSARWIRILGRNKDKLINELNESKELIALINKSTHQELSKEEREKVKKQFMDVLKSVPSVGIFLLPGGALLLPLILKIVPDLTPSAFKENEIKKK